MHPNNKYTSPRLYASKLEPRDKRKRFENGIGYVIPDGVSLAEFKSEYAKWEKKLKDSGFNDIEYRSKSQTGFFVPLFKENGSSATFQALYDPAKEQYFALGREFDSYMNEKVGSRTRWAHKFRCCSKVYRQLWRLHLEGLPYREVAKAFSGLKSHYMTGVDPVPSKLIRSRSVFWAHNHTHKILDHFWAWAEANYNIKDPR